MTTLAFRRAAGDVVPCPHCRRVLRYRLDTDGLTGRLVEIVEQCPCPEARRRAGICRDCPRPVEGTVGKALRCGPHKLEARRESSRGWVARNPERHREIARRYYQTDPEARERRNAYKREWRLANRDKTRAQKRRAALRRGGETAPGILRWREEVAAGLRVPERAPRNARGERLCLTPDCQTVLTGRAKKCEPCKSGYLPVEVQRAA
jgi:hypothetical protein